MHIITKKRILDFVKKYPKSKSPLENWYKIVNLSNFKNFDDVRKVFPSADQVGIFTVFNIGGNNFRLIAAIHYNRSKIYIREVLTHKEYDLGKWKEK